MSIFDAMSDFGEKAAQKIATDQRVSAIQELPFQGDLWYYYGPQTFEDGSTSEGGYGLKFKGMKYVAIAAGVAALYFAMGRR